MNPLESEGGGVEVAMEERVGHIQSEPGVGSIEDDLGEIVEQYLNGKLPGNRQRVTMTQTVQVELDGVQRTFQAEHLGRLKDPQRDDDLNPHQLRANLKLLKATAEDPHQISGPTMMKASMVISLINTMRAAKTPAAAEALPAAETLPAKTPSGADAWASRASWPSYVTATASGSGAASEASEQDAASASPSGANAYFDKLQRAVKRGGKEGPGVYAFAMGTPTELSVKEMTFRYLYANKEKTKEDLIALAEAGGNEELVKLLMDQQEISRVEVTAWAGRNRDAEVKALVNEAIHAFSRGDTGELDRASAAIARLMCLKPAVGAGQGVVRMTVGLSTQDVRKRLSHHLGKSMRGYGMLLAGEYNALTDSQKARHREVSQGIGLYAATEVGFERVKFYLATPGAPCLALPVAFAPEELSAAELDIWLRGMEVSLAERYSVEGDMFGEYGSGGACVALRTIDWVSVKRLLQAVADCSTCEQPFAPIHAIQEGVGSGYQGVKNQLDKLVEEGLLVAGRGRGARGRSHNVYALRKGIADESKRHLAAEGFKVDEQVAFASAKDGARSDLHLQHGISQVQSSLLSAVATLSSNGAKGCVSAGDIIELLEVRRNNGYLELKNLVERRLLVKVSRSRRVRHPAGTRMRVVDAYALRADIPEAIKGPLAALGVSLTEEGVKQSNKLLAEMQANPEKDGLVSRKRKNSEQVSACGDAQEVLPKAATRTVVERPRRMASTCANYAESEESEEEESEEEWSEESEEEWSEE